MANHRIPPPYPGLRPFEVHESLIFFGRESSVAQLLSTLETRKFIAIVGPSGCGKSSLTQAGLVAAIGSGLIPSERGTWDFAIMRPGDDPVSNLVSALLNSPLEFEDDSDKQKPDAIRSALERSPLGLAGILETHNRISGHKFLLIIDQFEEIFRSRFNEGDEVIQRFVTLLLKTATSVVGHVVVTMRSDFIGDCTRFWGLPEAMNEGQYLVPRLNSEELRTAIQGPAALHGAGVEEALIEQVLREVDNEPEQLALMQHALRRVWERATRKSTAEANTRLALEDYEAVGGIKNAISIHADEILSQLDNDSKRIAEKMFRLMCDEAGPGRAIRRPVRVQEIADVAQASIEQVAIVAGAFSRPDGNLLIATSNDFKPDTRIDIAHEALLRNWVRLRHWLETESSAVKTYLRIAEAARLYRDGKGSLLNGPQLAVASDWLTKERPTSAWASRYSSHSDFEMTVDFIALSRKVLAMIWLFHLLEKTVP